MLSCGEKNLLQHKEIFLLLSYREQFIVCFYLIAIRGQN